MITNHQSGLQAIRDRLTDLMHVCIRDIAQEYWRTGTHSHVQTLTWNSKVLLKALLLLPLLPPFPSLQFFSSHLKFSQMLFTVVVSGVTQEESSSRFAVSLWCSSTSILKNICQPPYRVPMLPFLASLMIIIFFSCWACHGFTTWINFGISCSYRKIRGEGQFLCNQKLNFSAIKSPVSQTVIADTFSPYLRIRPRCVIHWTAKRGSGLPRGRIPQIIYYPVAAFLLMKQHMKL